MSHCTSCSWSCFRAQLPWEATDDDVRARFEVIGGLVDCHVNDKRRGTATIRYLTPDQAMVAVDRLNGADFGGRTIHVRYDRFG
jgi:RNA recognition motif-containing protein